MNDTEGNMKSIVGFDEREFQAAEPLPADAVVIVIPDSLDHPALDGLIPAPTRPAPLAVPEPVEVEVPPPPVTAPDLAAVGVEVGYWDTRMRWTGSDYLYAGLLITLAATVTGIGAVLVVTLLPAVAWVAGVVSLAWGVAASAGPVLVGGGAAVGVWLLVSKVSKVKFPGKATAVTSGQPVVVKHPVREPVVNTPAPVSDARPARTSSPAPRGVLGRLFLGDDRPSTGRCNTSPAGDDLTNRWLARMRDKTTGQSVGCWRGVLTDPSWPTFETDINDDSAKCAVSWLLEEADPKGWHPKDSRGTKHGSWAAMNEKYGRGVVKNVIRMNDQGVRLPRIADYVEKKTSQ